MTRSTLSWLLGLLLFLAFFFFCCKNQLFCFVQHLVVWSLCTLFETSWKKRNCFARCEHWLLLSWCKALGFFSPVKTNDPFLCFCCFFSFFLNLLLLISQEFWGCKTRKGFFQCSLCSRFLGRNGTPNVLSVILSPRVSAVLRLNPSYCSSWNFGLRRASIAV